MAKENGSKGGRGRGRKKGEKKGASSGGEPRKWGNSLNRLKGVSLSRKKRFKLEKKTRMREVGRLGEKKGRALNESDAGGALRQKKCKGKEGKKRNFNQKSRRGDSHLAGGKRCYTKKGCLGRGLEGSSEQKASRGKRENFCWARRE